MMINPRRPWILVVDGDKEIVQNITSAIALENRFNAYRVISANDGVEAIKIINAKIPYIVSLDLHLRGRGGLFVAEKALELDRDCKILLTIPETCSWGRRHQEYASAIGIRCVHKPVAYDRLIEHLVELSEKQD